MERQPAVAGQFYSASPSQLRLDVEALLPESMHTRSVLGVISPHAGYMYSGAVAGQLYAGIEIPQTVLVLGPNHHGAGAELALYPEGSWQTPLGSVPINADLNECLLSAVPYIHADGVAHAHEHSLEVQLPFLKHLRPDVTLSALCVGPVNDSIRIREIGIGIAAAIRNFGKGVLMVASSDMTHYESAETARRKDGLALNAVINLDPETLLQVCRSNRITMCGVIPAAIMLVASCELGATTADLISYRTSGDVTGDNRQVVGYASLAVW